MASAEELAIRIDNCVICRKPFEVGGSPSLETRGFDTLVEFSEKLGDEKLH